MLNTWSDTLPVFLPSKLQQAILNMGSMTLYLKENFPEISVQVLEESDDYPFADELEILHIPLEKAKIRTVYLCSKGIPLIYARTIVPDSLWKDEHTRLYALGNTPLGQVLFDQKDPAKRYPFQFSKLDQRYFQFFSTQPSVELFAKETLLARRSVFAWHERGLLVTEVFLPAFIEYHHAD